MATPTTTAGRAFGEQLGGRCPMSGFTHTHNGRCPDEWQIAILAIEAEARDGALDEARAAVEAAANGEAFPLYWGEVCLAAIDALREGADKS